MCMLQYYYLCPSKTACPLLGALKQSGKVVVMNWRKILFLWLVCLAGIPVVYASPDNEAKVLRERYERGALTAYDLLLKYDTIILAERYNRKATSVLEHYKLVAFSNPMWVEKQFDYYDYAAMNAMSVGDMGRAMFNNYKLLDLAICKRNAARILRAYQFQVVTYGSCGLDERTLESFSKIKPVCDYAAMHARAFTAYLDKLSQIVVIYGGALVVYENEGKLKEISRLRQMLHNIDEAAATHPDYLDEKNLHIRYFKTLSDCVYYNVSGDAAQEHAALFRLMNVVTGKELNPSRKLPLALFSYYRLWYFHQVKGSTDSAAYYHQKYVDGGGETMPDIFMAEYYSWQADLEKKLGHEDKSASILANGMKTMDTVVKRAMRLQSNNMISQIESFMAREKLLHAEQRSTQLFYRMLIVALVLVILLLLVLVAFMAFRVRQRKKLANIRQELARNLHDQVGPMLFYSRLIAENALAKDEMARKVDLRKLGGHLSDIMLMVRDIAHEMKSNKTCFTTDLVDEVRKVLAENQDISGISFALNGQLEKKKLPLSAYNQLLLVIYELINNTLKHSGADTIRVDFALHKSTLSIGYMDNGMGFAEEQCLLKGIGLENIRERVALLRGRFQLERSSSAYKIEISIPIN